MAIQDKKKLREWVRNWEKAGLKLTKIRIQELRKFNYRDNIRHIDGMLEWSCKHQPLRTTSGLVEQQALFRKLAGKR